MTIYRAKKGVSEQQVGNERMLFDSDSDKVHVLNGSAAFIWDSIREPASQEEIRTKLDAEYDLSGVSDVAGMIEKILADFTSKGLLANNLASEQ